MKHVLEGIWDVGPCILKRSVTTQLKRAPFTRQQMLASDQQHHNPPHRVFDQAKEPPGVTPLSLSTGSAHRWIWRHPGVFPQFQRFNLDSNVNELFFSWMQQVQMNNVYYGGLPGQSLTALMQHCLNPGVLLMTLPPCQRLFDSDCQCQRNCTIQH